MVCRVPNAHAVGLEVVSASAFGVGLVFRFGTWFVIAGPDGGSITCRDGEGSDARRLSSARGRFVSPAEAGLRRN
jgi:hypothetical protein